MHRNPDVDRIVGVLRKGRRLIRHVFMVGVRVPRRPPLIRVCCTGRVPWDRARHCIAHACPGTGRATIALATIAHYTSMPIASKHTACIEQGAPIANIIAAVFCTFFGKWDPNGSFGRYGANSLASLGKIGRNVEVKMPLAYGERERWGAKVVVRNLCWCAEERTGPGGTPHGEFMGTMYHQCRCQLATVSLCQACAIQITSELCESPW